MSTSSIKEGYLIQRNGYSKVKRYVVLAGCSLFCYKDSSVKSPLAELDLNIYNELQYTTNTSTQFVLKSSEGYTDSVHFIAETPNSMQEWSRTIQSVHTQLLVSHKSKLSDSNNNDNNMTDNFCIHSSLPLISSKFNRQKTKIAHKWHNKESSMICNQSPTHSQSNISQLLDNTLNENKIKEQKQKIQQLQQQLIIKQKKIDEYQDQTDKINAETNKINELETKLKNTNKRHQQKIKTLKASFENEKKEMNEKEKGNEIRNTLLQRKKSSLTFLTVIIAMCSLFSSLGLSKFFGTTDAWNGGIAIGTSVISSILIAFKGKISWKTFKKHKSNVHGIEHCKDEIINKNWISRQFWMKSIYVTVSTINDCIFDILMGSAAIAGQPYTNGTWSILLAGTWFGFGEEFCELIVEIFFGVDICECNLCNKYIQCKPKPVILYSALLILSGVEALAGVFILIQYESNALKSIGVIIEIALIIIIVTCVNKFVEWNRNYHKAKKEKENQIPHNNDEQEMIERHIENNQEDEKHDEEEECEGNEDSNASHNKVASLENEDDMKSIKVVGDVELALAGDGSEIEPINL